MNTVLKKRVREISSYLHLLRKNQIPQTKLVILFRPRSGSSLLQSLLNSHPDMYCEGEIFLEKLVSKLLLPKLYLKSRYQRNIDEKLYSFKVSLYHLYRQKLDYEEFFDFLHENSWKIIYLNRLNVLQEAVSFIVAKKRKIWQDRRENSLENIQVYIDDNELISRIEKIEMSLGQEKKVLEQLPHLKIVYENDLLKAEKHQKTLDKIFDYLGTYSVPVKTDLVRTSSDNMSDYIQNYEELVKFIDKTKYAKFI